MAKSPSEWKCLGCGSRRRPQNRTLRRKQVCYGCHCLDPYLAMDRGDEFRTVAQLIRRDQEILQREAEEAN